MLGNQIRTTAIDVSQLSIEEQTFIAAKLFFPSTLLLNSLRPQNFYAVGKDSTSSKEKLYYTQPLLETRTSHTSVYFRPEFLRSFGLQQMQVSFRA